MDNIMEKVKNDVSIKSDDSCQARPCHISTNHLLVNRAISRTTDRIEEIEKNSIATKTLTFHSLVYKYWEQIEIRLSKKLQLFEEKMKGLYDFYFGSLSLTRT
jgi:hypothetical protein